MPTGPSAAGAPDAGVTRDHATERRIAEAGVLLVIVCWAANFVIVKAVLGEVPPLVFTGLRYIVAAATVLLILRWREGTIRMPLPDIAKAARAGRARVRGLPGVLDTRVDPDHRPAIPRSSSPRRR